MTTAGEPVAPSAPTVAMDITNQLHAERAIHLLEGPRRRFMGDPASIVIVDVGRSHVAIGGCRFAVKRRPSDRQVVLWRRELDGGGQGSRSLGRADRPTMPATVVREPEPAPVSPLREVAAGGAVTACLAVTRVLLLAAPGQTVPPRTLVLVRGGSWRGLLARRLIRLHARRLACSSGSDSQALGVVAW